MRSTTELKQHFLLLRRGRSLLSERRDSNPRPPAWKASALSTELLSQGFALLTPMWVRMDSNHRSRRQQIYSLPHLATLEHTLISKFTRESQFFNFQFSIFNSLWASSRTRTNDRWITNLVLYQLSYRGVADTLPTKKRAKVLLFFDMTKYFCKKMQFLVFFLVFAPFTFQFSPFLFPFARGWVAI